MRNTITDFWAHVDRSQGPDGCWEWTGQKQSAGYGVFRLGPPDRSGGQVKRVTHRIAYEHLRGPIPTGLHLDHLCLNLVCCNPAHLEPVTPSVNAHRGSRDRGARRTECRNGHPFTPANTYVQPSTGKRRCQECRKAARSRFLGQA